MLSNFVRSPLANLFNIDAEFPVLRPAFDVMKVDITENEKEFQVIADIPGVTKENIKVDFHNGLLSIDVESNNQKESKDGEKVWRMERSFSKKSRSFKFDTSIDDGAITAKYENGVLTLSLPKKVVEQKAKILIE
jgi:HSP20 family protein